MEVVIAIIALLFILTYSLALSRKDCSDYKNQLTTTKKELDDSLKKIHDLEHEIQLLSLKQDEYQQYILNREEDIKKMFSGPGSAFSYMAVLLSDYLLIDYDRASHFLETKPRPAHKEAMRIKELKEQTKGYITELSKYRYTLAYLTNIFPDLEKYIDEKESNNETSPQTSYDDNDSWDSLSDSEKSQLKLERYINRHKSNWEIGRDYELYVGYRYQQLGYTVDYCGSYLKLEDLGRDLIVSKNGEIGIIQCKYWSKEKLIHEKHIAQLYGTVVSYIIENQMLPGLVHGIFITNTKLSPMAKKFSAFLDIKYKENYPIGDFPRIKCNINTDEFGLTTKIYHLPTDQQYDNVKIEKNGECFVFTVKEAEQLGFRRAYKWHG